MRRMTSLFAAIFFALLLLSVRAHDEYLGKCPDFKPMDNFDWTKFQGIWYAMEKFDTHSKCLTYEFGQESGDDGEKFVRQRSELSGLSKLSVNNKAIYRGRLTTPAGSQAANMIVRFPLSILGSASFIVMDTDYNKYAMVCTCQSTKIFVELLTFHRRSCTILQRSPERDPDVSKKMHELLNSQVHVNGHDDKADHDFDEINHTKCEYSEDEKGLKLDVDKILSFGSGKKSGSGSATEYEDEYGDFVAEDGGTTLPGVVLPDEKDVELVDTSKLPLKATAPRL